MKKLLDVFPLVAVSLMPLGWFAAFFLVQTDWKDPTRLALYGSIDAATLVLALDHLAIINDSEDGRAPAWLVAFTYSKFSQVLAYASVILLVAARIYHAEAYVLEPLAYAMIGSAAVSTVLAATVFVIVARMPEGFRYCIRPWPWSAIGDLWVSRRKGK